MENLAAATEHSATIAQDVESATAKAVRMTEFVTTLSSALGTLGASKSATQAAHAVTILGEVIHHLTLVQSKSEALTGCLVTLKEDLG